MASAQTTLTTSPPSLSALAPFKAPGKALGANGQTAQGVVLSEAFLSLLNGYGPREDGDDGGSDGEMNGAQKDEIDDRRESAPGMLQVLQTILSLPVAQAIPVGTATLALLSAQSPVAAAGQDGSEGGSGSTALLSNDPVRTTINGFESAKFAPTISSPRLQVSNTPGNTPMAFAVRLIDANGQILNVPERFHDSAGITIRSNDEASPLLPDPNEPAVRAALLATAFADAELVQSQALTREAAHTGPQITRTTPAPAASSARAAPASAMPATVVEPKDIPPHPERVVEHAANTLDATRRPCRSSATPSADNSVLRQEETMSASFTAQTAPVVARTDSDTANNTDARNVTDADTRAITTMPGEIPETKLTVAPQPAREISMRLVQPESPSVDIRVVDRAGGVRVAVRTADTDLAQHLQSGLSDLVHRLERRGFEAEVWAPHSLNVTSSQNISATNERSAFQNSGRDPRDAQQGNCGQQGNGRSRPRWVAELEQKLKTGDREQP
jgi:hypothetical protein